MSTRIRGVKDEETHPSSEDNRSSNTKFFSTIRKFVAEPALLAQNLIRILLYGCIQDFVYDKVCRVNLQYPDSTCDALLTRTGKTTEYLHEETEVQKSVGIIMIWRTIFEMVFPIFLALVIGAWSDKYGRKHLLLFSLIGCLAESIALVICAYFKSGAGGWSVAIAGSVFTSMTGGFFCYKMAVMNYVSDTTSVEQRTVRLELLNSYMVGGRIVGLGIASKFAQSSLGFGLKFGAIVMGEVLVFLYVLYFIPNIRDGKILKGNRITFEMVRDVFNFKQAKDSISTVFKKREGNDRKHLLLLLFSYCCATAPVAAEYGIIYLFARYQFNWNSGDIAYFLTQKEIIQFLGSFVSTLLLTRFLKLSDSAIGFVACLNRLVASVVVSYGSHWSFIAGPVVGFLSGAVVVIPRSKITKIVPSGEMGRVGSFIASLDCAKMLCTEVLYTSVYRQTFEWFPGAVYILSAAFMIPPSIIFLMI